jgi:hypothetical protein
LLLVISVRYLNCTDEGKPVWKKRGIGYNTSADSGVYHIKTEYASIKERVDMGKQHL